MFIDVPKAYLLEMLDAGKLPVIYLRESNYLWQTGVQLSASALCHFTLCHSGSKTKSRTTFVKRLRSSQEDTVGYQRTESTSSHSRSKASATSL